MYRVVAEQTAVWDWRAGVPSSSPSPGEGDGRPVLICPDGRRADGPRLSGDAQTRPCQSTVHYIMESTDYIGVPSWTGRGGRRRAPFPSGHRAILGPTRTAPAIPIGRTVPWRVGCLDRTTNPSFECPRTSLDPSRNHSMSQTPPSILGPWMRLTAQRAPLDDPTVTVIVDNRTRTVGGFWPGPHQRSALVATRRNPVCRLVHKLGLVWNIEPPMGGREHRWVPPRTGARTQVGCPRREESELPGA